MKLRFSLVLLAVILPSACALSQSEETPIKASICEIVARPWNFDGKRVEVVVQNVQFEFFDFVLTDFAPETMAISFHEPIQHCFAGYSLSPALLGDNPFEKDRFIAYEGVISRLRPILYWGRIGTVVGTVHYRPTLKGKPGMVRNAAGNFIANEPWKHELNPNTERSRSVRIEIESFVPLGGGTGQGQ